MLFTLYPAKLIKMKTDYRTPYYHDFLVIMQIVENSRPYALYFQENQHAKLDIYYIIRKFESHEARKSLIRGKRLQKLLPILYN